MPVYRIAGICFAIDPQEWETQHLLQSYRVTDAPQETLSIPPEDAHRELPALLEQLSTVLTKKYQGMYLHGAALCYRGKAYLFTAPSGEGKSTHVALWKRHLGNAVTILNGDKPLLRCVDGKMLVYGGPWRGKEQWGENAVAELGGIYLLTRGSENAVTPVSTAQALTRLLSATVMPADKQGLGKLLELLGQLCESTPIYQLHCRPDAEAVETVRGHIDKGFAP